MAKPTKLAPPPEPPKFGETVYVVPTPNEGEIAVRAPIDGARLPDVGRHVAWSEYWARRVNDGDVVLADPPAEEPEAAASEPKSSAGDGGQGS